FTSGHFLEHFVMSKKRSWIFDGAMMGAPGSPYGRPPSAASLRAYLDRVRETWRPGLDDDGRPAPPVPFSDDHPPVVPCDPDPGSAPDPGTDDVTVDQPIGPPAPRRRAKREAGPDCAPKPPELDAPGQTIG